MLRRRECQPHRVEPLDPLMVQTELRSAIARGVGNDWLDALDQAVVPVHSELVSELRRGLVDGSDAEVTALVQLRQAHELALNFVDRVPRQSRLNRTRGRHDRIRLI